MKTHFPDPTNVLNFNLTITPDEGQSRTNPHQIHRKES